MHNFYSPISNENNSLSELLDASITDIVRAQGNNYDNPLVLGANSTGNITVRVSHPYGYENLGRIYVYTLNTLINIGNSYSVGEGDDYSDIIVYARNLDTSYSQDAVFYISLLLYKKGL